MINHFYPSLRGAPATRQSINILTATLAKTATRFVIALNAWRPLRALRCNKNWMTRTGRVMTILMVCGLVPMQALGCMYWQSRLTYDELIENAQTVVFAKVVSAELINDKDADHFNLYSRNVNYTFEVKEILVGESEKKITLQGRPAVFERDIEHYNNHTDEEFWEKHGGRNIYRCNPVYDGYNVGAEYLLFLRVDDPVGNHVKQNEIIFKKHDKWLQYVRDKVKEQAQ